MTAPVKAHSHQPGNDGAARGWSLRTRLIVWNVVALALLLGNLGIFVRCAVNSLLLISVDRRLETEVRISPPPRQEMRGPTDGTDGGGPASDDWHGPPPNGDHGPPPENGVGPPPGGDYADGGPDAGPVPPVEALRRGMNSRRRRDVNALTLSSADPVEPYAVRHFDLNGHALGSRGMLDATGYYAVRHAQSDDCFSRILIHGAPWRVLTRPYYQHGRLTAIAQAGYPLTEVNEALHGLDSAFLMMIPVGLLCAAAGGAYLTSHVLRSVRKTADAAARISISDRGDFSARLPVVGNDEFAGLAKTFNELLGRLEGAFQKQISLLDQQRRFTADASHELKTPLTVIRGNASMTLSREASPEDYKRSLQKIDRAAETMVRLVQDLLLLARSDSDRLTTNRIELLVADLLEQAAASVRCDGSSIPVTCPEEILTIIGNEEELVRVFVNLLTNAIRYTPPPGVVKLIVTKAEDYVRIRVSDTGIGIAREHLPHLGERFYRVDSSRTRADGGGSGLGLSICKSIIEAYGGTISFESVVGQGTVVSVFLPLAV